MKKNNFLIKSFCLKLSLSLKEFQNLENTGIGGIEIAELVNPDDEQAVPVRRPDVIVNPHNFEADVRNEDYRSHRLPGGIIESSTKKLKGIINHGDNRLELLLFPYLYPNGKGAWVYQGPCKAGYIGKYL